MELKAIIVEDEFLARENLKLMLSEFCEGVNVIDDASNITEAKEKIERLSPDVVFLDIRMPSGLEGFELLEQLERIDFMLVFTTAFKEYAIQAFKANAIDYILKPIEIEELQTVVEKLKNNSLQNIVTEKSQIENTAQNLQERKIDKIAISHSKGIDLIEIADIMRLQAANNYTEIYLTDGKKLVDARTMKSYQSILDTKQFRRFHNSHILNINQVKGYKNEDGHFAVMSNGDLIPISRANHSEFMNFIKQFKW